MLACGGDHFLDRGDVFGMVELRRDAEEIGQVEVPEPEHIHARHRRNLFHVLDAFGSLDQTHHQSTLVGDLDLVGDASADVIVGRKAERRAAPARGRIAGAGDDVLRLLGGTDHGRHDPHDTEVERARNVVVLVGWYPRHRHQVDAAACRHLVLDGFVTVPGMLHVEEQELRSRRFHDLRQAGNQELPAETAEDGLTLK